MATDSESKEQGIDDTSKKATTKKAAKKKSGKKKAKKKGVAKRDSTSIGSKYPRHTLSKALRIPRAIIEQNAGKECSEADSAKFLGVGYNGPYQLEISSALKYGLITRVSTRQIIPTELAKRIIRPQSPD